MPKVVDHQARREHIVDAAWALIGREGFEAATMRDIAAEAGFANGAIKPYFASKQKLLEAVYKSAFDRTNDRADVACADLAGRAAIEAFAREVLPLTRETRKEAAGVVAFWGAATDSPELKAIHERSMTAWRKRIAAWFIEAQDAGEFAPSQDPRQAADALVTFMLGAQVVLTMEPQNALPDMLTAQLEMLLDGFARDSDLTRDIAPVTA
ncbi:TetR/AcrR family transcriptional regulator [Pseudoglutamicibacter cumminsii]|uniref:TetR family transcriptional regulator n=1 Tax=Pseudoglutamicibacter cumminsii TaxID=156979 RepID=A0ABX5L6H8_9MICC|nr:TetR/AcrR family transcriptional regulator [Pseudoglutamicibacter cumminsii]PWI27716.1 TetR family transcriptional regulator [Pseudoglutamicibacter cumminsii]